MAIQKSFESNFGFTANNAYYRVEFFAFDLYSQTGRVIFNIYTDATAAANKKPPLSQIAYDITTQGVPAVYKTNENGEYVDINNIVLNNQNDINSRVVLRPAIPSFSDMLFKYSTIYNELRTAIYTEFQNQPELARGNNV